MRLISMAICLVFTLPTPALAQKLGEVPKTAPTKSAPRGEVLESTSAEGRPYWYRLPKKIDAKRPPSLVLMLHGTGGNHGWSFWNYPIATTFRPNDIVISPDGVTPGNGNTFNFVQNKKDGDQLAGLIRQFQKEFPIGKVYLYGHSQGAFFCYWFAGAYTQLVDGIIAHAGNVLSVDHNKLAKQKVAVCILHATADQVVPVDCAYRTEKIYKDQGYQKLRLEIVEGLADRAGHWPLPNHVTQMFEWLDQVSSDSAGQSVMVAFAELAKDAPDLRVIQTATKQGLSLIKKYKEDDKDEVAARLDALSTWLASVETAAAAKIEELRGKAKPDEVGSWTGMFTTFHSAFHDSKTWAKGLRTLVSAAGKHDKSIAKALKNLDTRVTGKVCASGFKTVASSPLGGSVKTLIQRLDVAIETAPKDLKTADVEAHRSLLSERASALQEGQDAAAELFQFQISEFRAEHATWFSSGS